MSSAAEEPCIEMALHRHALKRHCIDKRGEAQPWNGEDKRGDVLKRFCAEEIGNGNAMKREAWLSNGKERLRKAALRNRMEKL